MEEAKQCKLAYYATISFVDAQVGRLLDALEEKGLMDNTLIVFWSDHGYFLGEKGLWYKRKNFERSLRAPLFFAGPGIEQKGVSCFKPVELVDLFPTIVDYTGFEVPKNLDGWSLRPLLTDVKAKWNHPAISQVHHGIQSQGYSIRTERWRYTEWNDGKAGKELYDQKNDPDEITNLAGLDEHAKLVGRLSKQLQNYSDTYVARQKK
ncbi:sulfatase-like hydrolase/transferase [Akkermansiaceae bacterium]|nr:sulfatase-like hydrolase/transferase [Akkermansiaceae bacterium]